ncbi:predicted protein [Paecilomyces variotii No. 5]|uniref:Galactose oxidase n=1 Tax=Byssochlamys spectabilis (strain No. 5 / NBRC 109023) TaxID=1356009 RepID=V5FU66_BYSSN|nr:predicted protein [Paecilomyces variotii No. 5]
MLSRMGIHIVCTCSLLILWTQLASAAIPYTPSHIFLSHQNPDSLAYILQAKSSSPNAYEFLSLNFSGKVDPGNPQYSTLTQPDHLSSDKDSRAIVPVIDIEGNLKVYAGSCNSSASDGAVWQFNPDNSSSTGDGAWMRSSVDIGGEAASSHVPGPNYLAAGFAYSTYNGSSSSLYSFGGMCPWSSTSGKSWVSAANYSRSMLALSPSGSDTDTTYDAEISAARGPPIAEAGFTVTPLPVAFSNTSMGKVLEQQSFVFIGGHTQNAFINMSGIAIFSLPENSWTYGSVAQPGAGRSELAIRGITEVEPRSGHTAVLTPDGSKIIVFGGWVGDTGTPANPQLAILEVDEDYGGTGSWTWSVPSQGNDGLPQGTGIFGHGAALLPGDVMMVVGGYSIPSSSSKRSTAEPASNSQVYLYNITSNTWSSSYTNPYQQHQQQPSSKSGLLSSKSQKIGLGAGLGGGIIALLCIMIIFLLCCRKRRAYRRSRDQELRKLALGAERSHFWSEPEMSSSVRHPMSETGNGNALGIYTENTYPWAGNRGFGDGPSWRNAEDSNAQGTGAFVDVPSPTRGLRKAMYSRPYRYQPAAQSDEHRRPGVSAVIPPIDEREEYEGHSSEYQGLADHEQSNRDSQISQGSDPFKDPVLSPLLQLSPTKNRQSWMSDGESGYCSPDGNRSGSPSKSERTASSLSESSRSQSMFIVPNDRSDDYHRHTIHGQSPRMTGLDQESERMTESRQSPEKASLRSLGSQTQEQSSYSGIGFPFEHSRTADSFTTAHTSLPRSLTEGESLLGRDSEWATPPESPVVKASGGTKEKALNWIGNVRKAFARDVKEDDKRSVVGALGLKSDQMSTSSDPANETTYKYQLPRRAVSTSAAALKCRQGAKDWGAGKQASGDGYRSLSQTAEAPMHDSRPSSEDDEDWDVEAAAEGRLVQVTFTVPKEKLRVVNAGTGEIDDDDISVKSSKAVPQRVSSR